MQLRGRKYNHRGSPLVGSDPIDRTSPSTRLHFVTLYTQNKEIEAHLIVDGDTTVHTQCFDRRMRRENNYKGLRRINIQDNSSSNSYQSVLQTIYEARGISQDGVMKRLENDAVRRDFLKYIGRVATSLHRIEDNFWWLLWFFVARIQLKMESANPTPSLLPRIDKCLENLEETLDEFMHKLDGSQVGVERRCQSDFQDLSSQVQNLQQEVDRIKSQKVIQEVELKCLRERTKKKDHQIRTLKRDFKNIEAENTPPLSVFRKQIQFGNHSNRSEGHDSREEPTVNQPLLQRIDSQGSNRHSVSPRIN